MHDAGYVRSFDGVEDRQQDLHGFGSGQAAAPFEKLFQRFAGKELGHDEGIPPFRAPVVENATDRGVREACSGSRLRLRPSGGFRRVEVYELYRNFDVESAIVREPNDAHAAHSERSNELVAISNHGAWSVVLRDRDIGRRHSSSSAKRACNVRARQQPLQAHADPQLTIGDCASPMHCASHALVPQLSTAFSQAFCSGPHARKQGPFEHTT